MGKSITNLYRYAEISKACNTRYLDAMVDIVPVKSTLKEIEEICSGKKMGGKKVPNFDVWSKEVFLIMETVCDGRAFCAIERTLMRLPTATLRCKRTGQNDIITRCSLHEPPSHMMCWQSGLNTAFAKADSLSYATHVKSLSAA